MTRATDSGELRVLARFLAPRTDAVPDTPWLTQVDIAAGLNLTRARISQVVVKARARWAKDPMFTRLRADVAELVTSHGNVMSSRELAQALLALRGSDAPEPTRTIRALAAARAAVEAERERDDRRFTDFRRGTLLVATSDEAADYADQLGRVADRLAALDPLAPPSRVMTEMDELAAPEGASGLVPARVVQLAAAASHGAAASSRLEIYPRGMSAERALRLAQGALLGAQALTVSELRSRVAGRYPEAAALPDRPELDAVLAAADLGFEWDSGADDRRGAYRPRQLGGLITPTTPVRTRTDRPDGTPTPTDGAQAFDRRVRFAIDNGAFLALTVEPKLLQSAARRLARAFPLTVESIEALLIQELRATAARAGADWNVVRRADGEGPRGADWGNLLALVAAAIPQVEARLAAARGPLLVSYPGLLARYDQLGVLGRLQETAGRPGGPSAVLVLLAADGQRQMPTVDGRVLPVITSNQWMHVPDTWVETKSE